MKNEKVMLVILAYIIGFQTAYIAFGLTDDRRSVAPGDFSPAASIEKTTNTSKESLSVSELSDGLYATLGNQERLLSAQVIGTTKSRPGFHNAVISSSVSPNKKFIHYCVQETESSKTCSHYIYELAADTTYRVETEGGSNVDTDFTSASAIWDNAGLFLVGNFISYNSEKPWWVMVK